MHDAAVLASLAFMTLIGGLLYAVWELKRVIKSIENGERSELAQAGPRIRRALGMGRVA